MLKCSQPRQRNRSGHCPPPAETLDGSEQRPNATATSPTAWRVRWASRSCPACFQARLPWRSNWSRATVSTALRSLFCLTNGGVGYWNPLNTPAWGAGPSREKPGPLVAALLTFPLDASPSGERIMHQKGVQPGLPRSQSWRQDEGNAVPAIP